MFYPVATAPGSVFVDPLKHSRLSFLRCVKKQMKAERWATRRAASRAATAWARHTSRHTSPEDGDFTDSRKGPKSSSELEGSLPSSGTKRDARLGIPLSRKRYFDCQKTEGAGFMPPREAARSFNSLEFALRFGSGSPLPLN